MRFLQGLFGSAFAILAVNATLSGLAQKGPPTFQLVVYCVAFSAVASACLVYLEKPTWRWVHYIATAVLTAGGLMCALATFIMLAAADEGNFAVQPQWVVAIIGTSLLQGAIAGIGFRLFAGTSAT